MSGPLRSESGALGNRTSGLPDSLALAISDPLATRVTPAHESSRRQLAACGSHEGAGNPSTDAARTVHGRRTMAGDVLSWRSRVIVARLSPQAFGSVRACHLRSCRLQLRCP